MNTKPFTLIGSLVVLLWAICAYLIRVAERPNNEAFEQYFSALWCVAVTMTTVGTCEIASIICNYLCALGYGDMYPESHMGRTVAILSTILGTCLVALLLAAVQKVSEFSNNEEVTRWALYKSRLTCRVHNKAAHVIQCLFRVGIARGRVRDVRPTLQSRKSKRSTSTSTCACI
jgi:hypothetical protein